MDSEWSRGKGEVAEEGPVRHGILARVYRSGVRDSRPSGQEGRHTSA